MSATDWLVAGAASFLGIVTAACAIYLGVFRPTRRDGGKHR